LKQEGHTRPNISGAQQSLRVRAQQITRYIHDNPENLRRLADACDKTRTLPALLSALHLSVHPSIMAAYDADFGSGWFGKHLDPATEFGSHRRHALVDAIVYRKDPITQFSDLAEFQQLAKGNDDTPSSGSLHTAQPHGGDGGAPQERARDEHDGPAPPPASRSTKGGLPRPPSKHSCHRSSALVPLEAAAGSYPVIINNAARNHFMSMISPRHFYTLHGHVPAEFRLSSEHVQQATLPS
jgi:hypothetical protein